MVLMTPESVITKFLSASRKSRFKTSGAFFLISHILTLSPLPHVISIPPFHRHRHHHHPAPSMCAIQATVEGTIQLLLHKN